MCSISSGEEVVVIVMVTGGSASGKSELAEQIATQLSDKKRLYIATMKPFDDESIKRIEKHRFMRVNKQFDTLEVYEQLEHADIPDDYSIVLLECLSNLLANSMFGCCVSDPVATVYRGIQHLCERLPHVVVVTNEVFSDGQNYDDETMEYIQNLGRINRLLAECADVVIESVCGLPVTIKGEFPC